MNVNWKWIGIVFRRFLKVFIFGGIGSLSAALVAHPLYFSELNTWIATLIIAFLAGGFAALEKWNQGFDPNR